MYRRSDTRKTDAEPSSMEMIQVLVEWKPKWNWRSESHGEKRPGGGSLEALRISSQIMKIKMAKGERVFQILSVYSPQLGEAEKEIFWGMLDDTVTEIPLEERVILGGDLNGHIGRREETLRK